MGDARLTGAEQLLIELANRARLDPAGEAERLGVDLNSSLPPGTISTAPKAPLAPNTDLLETAADHTAWMLATGTFSHSGAGGLTSAARMAGHGYVFAAPSRAAENIGWQAYPGPAVAGSAILDHHRSLFSSADHRSNILGDYREVGMAQELGPFNGMNSSLVTQDFARSGTRAFVTGVAIHDRDGDRFYDVGEGRGGVAFDWLGNAGGAASTRPAGGYAVGIPLGLTGPAAIAVTAGTVTREVTLTLTGDNVKLDLIGTTLSSSASMVLGEGAQHGMLLGVAAINLSGNGLDNVLSGNGGDNRLMGSGGEDLLRGGGGNDRLSGGAGDDRLQGGAGRDSFLFTSGGRTAGGDDEIVDLRSGDRIVIDLPGALPSESAWESAQVSAIPGGWRIKLDDGGLIDVTGGTRSLVLDALVLV